MKWRAFREGGLRVLFSQIRQLKTTADGNTSTIASLGNEFAALATQTAAALNEKQEKPKASACMISASGWGSDNTAGYPHYYDMTVPGVTVRDIEHVVIAPASLETASACGLCTACETGDGVIRLRAASIPAADMTA